jgi:hypothetical protein
MEKECCEVSGSRRQCAGIAVANALGAADLIAVITPPEHQAEVAEGVLEELEAQGGTRVLRVDYDQAPWRDALHRQWARPATGRLAFNEKLNALWELLQGIGPEDPSVQRAVLFWTGVDGYLAQDEKRFIRILDLLCEALAQPPAPVWAPFRIHRAVLIGGDALLALMESLAERKPENVQCRMLLVP